MAKVNHDLENYETAKKLYAHLRTRDPDLAQQFAYLDLKEESSTRSSNASGSTTVVAWNE